MHKIHYVMPKVFKYENEIKMKYSLLEIVFRRRNKMLNMGIKYLVYISNESTPGVQ